MATSSSAQPVSVPRMRSTNSGARTGLSVVIPSYRRPGSLKSCLIALAAQTLQPLEVVVVVRADDDESHAAIAEIDPTVRVVTVDHPGQVVALNRGCEASHGEFIAITDDDAVPRPDWLDALAARFATDAGIGAVGGRDVVHHGQRIEDADAARVGRVLWWGRRIGNHHLRSHLQDVDFLKGVNMAFRATAWRPFDPHLRGAGAQVCNDLEATWSVRRRGWRVVYDPDVVVDHRPAPRHDADGREQRSVRAERDEQHNEVYALLRHAAWWHRPILLVYRTFVGSRQVPGLLLLVRPGVSAAEGARVRGLTAARLSAIHTLHAARRMRG
jgi:cellulose synthase/poly-beta-1,6-N-acetylglucosamine synthase-like glycosyltransferase